MRVLSISILIVAVAVYSSLSPQQQQSRRLASDYAMSKQVNNGIQQRSPPSVENSIRGKSQGSCRTNDNDPNRPQQRWWQESANINALIAVYVRVGSSWGYSSPCIPGTKGLDASGPCRE